MIKRFNTLVIAITLFASSLYSFGGTVPSGLPTIYGFGCADKQDPYAPDMPNRWKDGQGTTCWDYSYQYLVPGWATWSANGAWARDELLYWEARGQIQVFTYYYSYGNRAYFQNSSNMQGYWRDLKLLFQVINANSSKKVIVHFEPDGIGFWRQANVSASATGSVLVGSVSAGSGVTEISGLPDSLQGWSRGIKILRDTYAPNKALLAHHYTHWATGSDVFVTDVNSSTQSGCDSHVDNMTNYMLSIENGAANAFDLFFVDPSDRDAAWYDAFGAGQRWTADTWGGFAGTRTWGRIGYIVNRVSTSLNRRGMMWQIPEGNEYYTTCNNTDGHYKDDHAQEAFLRSGAGGPGDGYVAGSTTNGPGFWANNGIIATLFGSGYYGQKPPDGNNVTHVRNYKNDGITGNGPYSDDDGGYIRLGVAAYCSKGKFPLPGSTPPTPVGTPTRTRTTGPTATRTPSFTITPTFSQTPFICSKMIYDGDTAGIRLADGATTASAPGTMTEVTGGTPGNAMRLNYAVPFATPYWQAHKWVPPAAVRTIADNTTLRFEVKTTAGTAPNFIIVIDWSSTTYQVPVNTYVTGGIDATWKTAVIPLSVLKAAAVSNINEINFINNDNTAYIVLVDNIRLTGGACPSATPTISATYTRTSTRTVTATGTNSSTPQPTSTYTRTRTATPSFSTTPTYTATPTRTVTIAVPTVTFTSTRTQTPVNTSTNTALPPTATFTATPSRTRTVVVPSLTFTSTRTLTPVNTATNTAVPPTYTYTRTITAEPSLTFTRTNTRTVTHSPTITNTWTPGYGTQTNTPTITLTGTRTRTATVTYTRTAAPTLTATDIVPTVTYTSSRTSTATRVPSVTVTPSYTRTASPTRTFTMVPSQTFTETPYFSPTVTNTVDLGTQPDLVILDISITMLTVPPCPTGSEALGTLVTFRNTGNDDAGPFDVELNGQVINVAGLLMGASGSVWFAGQAIPGNTTAVIDFNLDVSESNETNNTLTRMVPVPSALPTCTFVVTETFTATEAPTEAPTQMPTETATQAPTDLPTELPTGLPTELPTGLPTELPTGLPTELPTGLPTELPTDLPTQIPTDTATAVPTNTQVITATYTVTPSVTRTSTLVSTPTLTRTPTVTATSTMPATATATAQNTPVTLVLSDNKCLAYPNPALAGSGFRIRFNINRTANKAVCTMYTTSLRKVRHFERQASAVVNNLSRGDNEMLLTASELEGLAAGVYYYFITVDNNGQSVRSKTEKIIILK